MPDPDLPFSFPGTTAVGSVSGRSETTFNSSNDIEVELSAATSLVSIDSANGIPGTYGANVQAASFFNFEVDEITEAYLDATVNPRSSSSGWQIRLSGGPAGFVFNNLTNPGASPFDLSWNVTLFPGWNYALRSNVSAGTSVAPGAGDSASAESIDFRLRTTAIPEPGSLTIFGLAAILGLAKRKRRIA